MLEDFGLGACELRHNLAKKSPFLEPKNGYGSAHLCYDLLESIASRFDEKDAQRTLEPEDGHFRDR